MRHVLIDKQGNFGSIAGLPAGGHAVHRSPHVAHRRADAGRPQARHGRLRSHLRRAADRSRRVLPSKFPNLLVNGANGIAVGMATSIPPHNLGEICDALVRVIDEPGGVDRRADGDRARPRLSHRRHRSAAGRASAADTTPAGARSSSAPGRTSKSTTSGYRIVITEIPYQQARDRIEERIAALVNEGRIAGISGIRNESDLKEPVRLVCELKRDADPDVVLNQLYQFSPLQDSFSLIFLALVDGKPRVLSFKELLQEFIRHRVTVIRRRTQFLLARARQRKHTVEGLLLAHANIDEVIRVIRASSTQAEAKERLMQIETPAAMLRRALGEEGFAIFAEERGVRENYTLTPVQADAILRMTLGQLVNLEQEKLAGEHHKLLDEIAEYLRILSDRQNILDMIRDDCRELKRKHGDARRTEISGEELGDSTWRT